MKRGILLALVATLLFSLLPQAARPALAAQPLYVVADAINVRTAPSLAAMVVRWAYYGEQIGVVDAVQGDPAGGSSTWYRTDAGHFVAAAYLSGEAPATRAATSARSAVRNPGYSGRWIDVNLSTLQVSAMVGDSRVYLAPATTGKAGWETPTGTFTIKRRYRYDDMDSATLGIPVGRGDTYYVKDVPYVQYFDNAGDAIHGSYWSPSDSFGNYNASHGCVSLRVADAAYFWDFGYLGMPVVIHY